MTLDNEYVRQIKYTFFALAVLASVTYLQLSTVAAQTDNSDTGDNSGSFGQKHPTFCTLAPPAASALGHPLIGVLIDGICTLP